MLGRKHLRGRHQAALPAVCRAHKKGQKSEDGLPASHIPLYQTVHGRILFHIRLDLRPYPQLRSGKPVGKLFQQPARIRHAVQRIREFPSPGFLLQTGKPQKELQEFVEGKPPYRCRKLVPVRRTVDPSHRLQPGDQIIFLSKLLRQKFRQKSAIQPFQRPPHRPDHHPVGQSLCQRVPGLQGILQPGILLRAENSRLLHLHQRGARCRPPRLSRVSGLAEPPEDVDASRLQNASQIRHAEKSETKKAGRIAGLYSGYDQGTHPLYLRHADHGRTHGAHPSGRQRRNGHWRVHFFVVSGVMLQKLPHICNMESGEKLRGLFADSLN